jgi:peroxiredoxin Q/BCP
VNVLLQLEKKAPDFCLQDQDHEALCLHDFLGKWVVLYFYPKDNTPGCTLEAISFTRFNDEFEKLNTVVLGISPDSCESHKDFQQKHDLSVTLLSDRNHEALTAYEVWKPKHMFGKEFFGVARSTFIINPEGQLVHHWSKVKVPGHIEKVLEKLRELQQE